MKKILFVTGSQTRTGGTERVCADLCNILSSNKNICLTVLSLHNGKSSHFPIDSKVTLEELTSTERKGYANHILYSYLLLKYVNKYKPDIIIGVESIIFLNMAILKILPYRPKIICWEHFNIQVNLGVQMRDFARYLASRLADAIVVLSEEDELNWHKKFKHAKNKIYQIYNPNPFEENLVNIADDPDKQNIVFAAGRLTYQKGFDLLIESWNLISPEIRSNWQLRIAGEGEDRAALETLIQKYKLTHSIKLLGNISNIEKEYRKSKIFALSSRFEGFGLVLLEALSYQLPIVSFKCPSGPSEIVINNFNGILVNNNDVKGFSEALEFLMAENLILKDFKKATNYNIDRFGKKAINQKWIELIDKLN